MLAGRSKIDLVGADLVCCKLARVPPHFSRSAFTKHFHHIAFTRSSTI